MWPHTTPWRLSENMSPYTAGCAVHSSTPYSGCKAETVHCLTQVKCINRQMAGNCGPPVQWRVTGQQEDVSYWHLRQGEWALRTVPRDEPVTNHCRGHESVTLSIQNKQTCRHRGQIGSCLEPGGAERYGQWPLTGLMLLCGVRKIF